MYLFVRLALSRVMTGGPFLVHVPHGSLCDPIDPLAFYTPPQIDADIDKASIW